MTSTDHAPTVAPFDPFAVAPTAEVRAALADRRARCPVSQLAPGMEFVASHPLVKQALLEGNLSNAGNFVLEGDDDGPAPPSLITQSDPPDHTALRDLLRPAFARQAITEATPWIRDYVDGLIAGLPAGGPADVVSDFALPLTAAVIARLVGVPSADADELADLSLAITAMLPGKFVGTPEWIRLEAYFTEAARRRRSSTDHADDVLTRLATVALSDGRSLTDQEVAFHAWQVFVAGLESTAYTIGATVWQLLAEPGLWASLVADRSTLDTVREEGLRHASAIRWVLRTVTAPTELGGETFTPQERVLVGLESANLDEQVFGANAADFDPSRTSARRHVSFGHGIHLCLGAELSRLEISAALSGLLDRLPTLRLADGAAYDDVQSPMFNGPQRVDVVW